MSVDAARCPLCQRPNACGMAAGKTTCWCFNVKLDPDALAKIPEEAKGKACICESCGTKGPLARENQKP